MYKKYKCSYTIHHTPFPGSSGAIPFSAVFTLLFLWFCVSVPLVFLGSFFGYKKESMSFPVRTNLIPRAIPQQVCVGMCNGMHMRVGMDMVCFVLLLSITYRTQGTHFTP
ncbi:hypothetical protein EON63_10995 [archaeon]|nr:MAG: hypothetical protein EON63_10995 [archaeon]